MLLPFTLLLALLAQHSASALTPAKRYYSTHNYYVLEHDPYGDPLATVALELSVEVVEQAGELPNHWLVRARKPLTRRDTTPDPVLLALERLQVASRDATQHPPETQRAKRLVSSIRYFSPQIPRLRVKRAPPPIPSSGQPSDTNSTTEIIAQRLGIQDPLFTKQWHLVNEEFPHHMMNVTPLWDMGITGKGVISALVDDGLDYRSADLAANFVKHFLFSNTQLLTY